VVHYVDIPIQHINDDILKAMRRGHTKKSTAELIEQLRKAIPDVVLRTTVIAGFPGETDPQFKELLDFIRQVQFDALGCFPFFPEPGTPAAELANPVPHDIRQSRADEVMTLQQPIAFQKVKERIGSELKVLVDEDGKKQAVGRFYGQAPHIDSLCLIQSKSVYPGSFIETQVTSQDGYDLIVKPVHTK
jgi:ribosomal protein S12 methylthiotransferase